MPDTGTFPKGGINRTGGVLTCTHETGSPRSDQASPRLSLSLQRKAPWGVLGVQQ